MGAGGPANVIRSGNVFQGKPHQNGQLGRGVEGESALLGASCAQVVWSRVVALSFPPLWAQVRFEIECGDSERRKKYQQTWEESKHERVMASSSTPNSTVDR